ncbi:MAG TPA: hypothetical protein VGC47_06760 [Acidimicrobiia bacterium]
MNFMWGYLMGSRDQSLNRAAASSMSAPSTPEAKVMALHDRIDRLVLVVQAMWALLEESGLSPEQLEAKIGELDMLDGHEDGRVTRSATECRHCGAAVPPHRTTCQFCGGDIGDHDPFAQV